MKKKIPKKLNVSICVPAYNEGKNITKILEALVTQKTKRIRINSIVVVSSGSTDETDTEVKKYCKKWKRCILIREPTRLGKASAINAFLKNTNDEIVVIESADTIPRADTIEKLCLPFLKDPKIGMTGGAPIPVNDPNTFLGYIIHTWWWFHRHIPRFGEIIAYRNVLTNISPKTAVDEAFIQAKLIQLGYKIVHVDEAVVRNKGPETVADLIRQRRRIFNGHARLHEEENVKINNMTMSSLRLLFVDYKVNNIKELVWFCGGIGIEGLARLLGHYDSHWRKINPYIWDIAKSTKSLKKDMALQNPMGIVFLNFAPIQFMGGAERWMLDVATSTSRSAKTILMDVHPSIANIYGKAVLGQKFSKRTSQDLSKGPPHHLSLTFSAFVPFTQSWRESREALRSAKTIYIRYEVLETLIVLYLGGLGGLKKTVAGIHSAFIYRKPIKILDHIHNAVYTSLISKLVLNGMQKIHVLNIRDQQFFKNTLKLKNVVCIPNYTSVNESVDIENNTNSPQDEKLNIAFIGELSIRKGVDILIDTISKSTNEFVYHIAGAGPMGEELKRLASKKNVKYYGYIQKEKMKNLYSDCDLLFSPSRAESFSLASLEAMSHGLSTVSSPATEIGLPKYIQHINRQDTPEGYIKLFRSILNEKRNKKLAKHKISVRDYAIKTFSRELILSQLHTNLFDLNYL
ncbi:glycosyltransferase [Candidatus Microgenomates bacterium]|nr:glycosyltransferase [Candidatus Microgenomates bacterium]